MNKKIWFLIIYFLLLLIAFSSCNNKEKTFNSKSTEIESSEKTIADNSSSENSNSYISVGSVTPQKTEGVIQAQQKYPASVGWLTVNGTNIDTFIVQNPPWENAFYLQHNLEDEPDSNGTYCADYTCIFPNNKHDELSFNTTLYAHNFDDDPNGILFAQLKKYKDPEFAKNNPYIFFSTQSENMAFEVFAIYDTTVELPYIYQDWYWDAYSKMFDVIYDSSIYDYGTKITPTDKILTLSTCTYDIYGVENLDPDIPNDYRFVVMARLIDPSSELKTTANFVVKDSFLHPDEQPQEEYWDDKIKLNDKIYFRIKSPHLSWYDDISEYALKNVGNIKRTAIHDNMENFDASFYPTGATIMQNPLYPGAFFIKEKDNIWHIYWLDEEPNHLFTKITVYDFDGNITTPSFKLISDHEDEFLPFLDKVYAKPLADDLGLIEQSLSENEKTISVYYENDNYSGTEDFYALASPPSLGYEVMIIIDYQNNLYYMPKEKYYKFLSLIND